MSITFRTITSGPLKVLPTPTGGTQVTVKVQGLKLGTKVALAAVLKGVTYGDFDNYVAAGTTLVGQILGTHDKLKLNQAQDTITENFHPGRTRTVYRSTFVQRNPISGNLVGASGNPPLQFVLSFSDLAVYYKVDALLSRAIKGGVLRLISAVKS